MRKRRIYRKPHRYKRKKPIFHQRFFWLGILALIVAGGIFYCLFFLEAFQIEKIIVSGDNKVAKEDIEFLAGQRLESKILFFKTKSIFAVDLGQIKKYILNYFPQIAEVKISRGFFDAVNVIVTERQALAVWCQDEKCFLLDQEGIIFEEVIEDKPELVLIKNESGINELGKRVIEKELLSQVLEIKAQVEGNTGIPVKEAFLVSEERLNMKTAEGWEIYFNLKGDLGWQITELKLVLEKQIPLDKRGKLEYIDLRFSRVYYK